jgi:hypothetical protein
MDSEIPFGLSPREKKLCCGDLLAGRQTKRSRRSSATERTVSPRSGGGSGKNFKSKPTTSLGYSQAGSLIGLGDLKRAP